MNNPMNAVLLFSIFLVSVCMAYSTLPVTEADSTADHITGLKWKGLQSSNAGLSGNMTVVVINETILYADEQIESFVDYILDEVQVLYPNVNVNITYAPGSTEARNITLLALQNNSTDYIVSVGSNFARTLVLHSNIVQWIEGINFTHVRNIGFIDSRYPFDQSHLERFSVAEFNHGQGGFMAGVKSAVMTENHKIGVLLDPSTNFQSNNIVFKQNQQTFLSGFIAGVRYAGEHLLNNTDILVKAKAFDNSIYQSPAQTTQTLLKDLKESFGADVVLNLMSGVDPVVMTEAATLGLDVVVCGANQTQAQLSMVQRLEVLFMDMLNYWNQTETEETYSQVFDIGSPAMSLTDYGFGGSDDSMLAIQANVTSGIILVPSNLFLNSKATNGFGYLSIFLVTGSLLLVRRFKHS